MKRNYTYSFLKAVFVAVLSVFVIHTTTAQYCTLTCIEDIQVSVGLDCEATVNYRMVLQDPDNSYSCSPNGPSAYKIVVMGMDSIPIPSSPTISCEYIGQTLTVKANHWLTGNSCWSTLKVEDKIAPQLDCGEPVEVWCNESIAPESEGGDIPLPILKNKCSDTCETLTYTYKDEIGTFDCEDEMFKNGNVARVERRWTVCDGFNNCGTCTQTILVKNLIFSEIEIPESSFINCRSDCNINDIVCVDGPTIHGEPINEGFCNVEINYKDLAVQGCEGTSVITRTWSIINPCTRDSINRVQQIHIVDNTPPDITCSSIPVNIILDPTPTSCIATIDVPAASIQDDCSSAKNIIAHTSVYHLLEDGNMELLARKENTNGGFSQKVLIGTIAIVYEAIDDCGNSYSNIDNPCIIEVIDDLAPTPVCNGSTRVSITSDGQSSIFANSFDSGSYDNCCIKNYLVRRMEQPESDFSDFVDFTCEDTGKKILVVLRLIDCNDNYADCMIEVEVDDKNAPQIESCPPAIPIDCKDGITLDKINEAFLGTPVFVESCTPDQVTYSFSIKNDYRNECGLGAVIYEWLFVDAAGNTSTCEQVISFYDTTEFKVDFPEDFKPEQCYGLADLVPSLTGAPQVSEVDCGQVELDYVDVVTSTESICRKVERTWTATNVCATEANKDKAIITHVQLIEINDTEAPVVTCGTSVSVCIDNDACSVAVDVAGISVQDCGSEITALVDWVFTPNSNCSGEVISGKVSNGLAGFTSPKFGPGILMVTFNVSDNCGNVSVCTREYLIKDCKAPTVSCQSGIVLPLEEDGKAVFWAKDFDEKSFDNCATCFNGNLLFSFSTTVGDSSQVYTCENVGEQPVVIYVTDHAGNQTFCETNIIIQSPNGICGTTTGGGETGGGTNGTTGGGETGGGETGGGTTGDIPVGGDNSVGTGTNGTTGGGETGGGETGGGTTGGSTSIELGTNCGTSESICILGNACTATANVVGVEVNNFCGDKIDAVANWQFIPNSACKGEIMEGQVVGAINGFTSAAFGPGTLVVVFEITDGCGNTAICERVYEINDCQPPTARCLNGLTLGLGEDGTVEFWAKDFNQNTTDNCSDCGSEVIFSFSESSIDSGFVFDCSHVGTQTIELFMTDAAGNRNSCVVNFTVTGVAACAPGRTVPVNGNILTEQGEKVSFVDLILQDMETGVMNSAATQADGTFAFEAPVSRDYLLTPERNDNIDNGVTTFDLIILQRHIIGLEAITSPYQLIAADVNNSGSITALDMVELRKAILHLSDQFPNNTSWRFIDSNYTFENPQNPTKELMPQEVYISQLDQEKSFDFIAVKVGDINGSATVNSLQSSEPRSRESLLLTLDDQQLKKGEEYDITFRADRLDVQGIQFTMKYAPEDLLFKGVQANEWVAPNHFGNRYLSNGLSTFSWNRAGNVNQGLEYTITLQAQRDGMLSQLLSLSSALTPTEAYTLSGQILDVQLNYQRTGIAFELLQNTPNPFAQNTIIPFTLPQRDRVHIMIMNTSGKILKQIDQEFEKGYNEVEVKNITTSGVLYYRIKTGSKIATKKMIRLE